jgi:hypothetical protein
VVRVILNRFPQPSGSILKALEMLAMLRDGDPGQLQALEDLSELPRPWEPATCPQHLRAAVWRWCDQVTVWLNTDYAWRPAHLIPACWPRHPHIARELVVLAFLRLEAEEATGPHLLEDWQRYSYPMFCDRMAGRLGDSTCRVGKHQDWPAESRVTAYIQPAASAERRAVLTADSDSSTNLVGAPFSTRRGGMLTADLSPEGTRR